MKTRSSVLIALAVVLCTCLFQTPSQAELHFGPWVYYAPYYFPPPGACYGWCFGPDDFLPKYETPPPPMPRYDGFCPPPMPRPPIRKMAQAIPRHQVSAPLTDMPRRLAPSGPAATGPVRSTIQQAPRLAPQTDNVNRPQPVVTQPQAQPQPIRSDQGQLPGGMPPGPGRRMISPSL